MTQPDKQFIYPVALDNPIAYRGSCIRFDTLSQTGNSVVPRIYVNKAHRTVGLSRVYVDWNDSKRPLVCEADGAVGDVISIQCTPDETLCRFGMRAGPSGGNQRTRVYFYDKDNVSVPAGSLRLYDKYANLWIDWHMWIDEPVVLNGGA